MDTTPPRPGMEKAEGETFFRDIIKYLFIALVIVVPIRFYIAQPFIVNGASMESTFDTGQYLIVDELTYRLEEPKRGQVIIFNYPKDPSKFFIKRIIGLPGETVTISGTNVTIKNDAHPEGFLLNEPYVEELRQKDDYLTTTLGPAEYFVLGDNRAASSDSRAWGAVPRDLIVGRAFVRLFPFTLANVLPGDYSNLNAQ